MSEQHREEQEMEAEALTAIFDNHFRIVEGSAQPFRWNITLLPEPHDDDTENHVGINLEVTLPVTYPEDEDALPECQVSILKGLTQDHAVTLQQIAQEEAQNNAGVPSVFAICEVLREWLVEHNQKGHDDVSMHAQMLRKQKEKEQQEKKQLQQATFESQKATAEMTDVEREDLELRRRRAEGTPVNRETFEAWKINFDIEMRRLRDEQVSEEQTNSGSGAGGGAAGTSRKKKKDANAADRDAHKIGRITGRAQFSDKAFDLQALEAAAELAQSDPDEQDDDEEDDDDQDFDNDNNDGDGDDNDNDDHEEDKVQEELFDVDDEDLDDLDFDDEEDDDEDVDI